MLSFGWALSVGAALLLTIQQSCVAEPAGGHYNHQEVTRRHLEARARKIVGQQDSSSPPCVRNLCPLSLRGRSEETASYSSGQKDSHDPAAHQAGSDTPGATAENKPRFPGTRQTVPITCGDGTKPPCGQARPEADKKPHFPGTHQTAPITCGDGTKPPCGQTHPESDSPRFPGTHQTAPINCGDGTKPPCGQARPTVAFPATHQTAPILCGDRSQPPCGHAHPAAPKRFPGTHQTAPISCGDGTKPPCGPLRSVVAFPGTHPGPCGDDISAPCDPMQPASLVGVDATDDCGRGDGIVGPCVMITEPGREPPHPDLLPNSTAPIPGAVDDCGRGDGIEGPCVIIDPGREPPHPDLLPNPAVPNTCPDGSKGPCAHTQSPHHSSNFPGTHQTAPVTCGDGTKPPCHSNVKAY
ncbi:hypothetical protein PGT21_013094 [Puccinia graminis f. sp. tritici]|uniref:Uncharacterized protein n=1 Tax=Puccinia graminis f. sp. tritici TaxID=56615 RepID=A0A5B0QMN8_PUCGR|nr:hypothetical protein PGT21_013094 [Puccinia graminis f. sp. tritici]